jgi:hypothetical protein
MGRKSDYFMSNIIGHCLFISNEVYIIMKQEFFDSISLDYSRVEIAVAAVFMNNSG